MPQCVQEKRKALFELFITRDSRLLSYNSGDIIILGMILMAGTPMPGDFGEYHELRDQPWGGRPFGNSVCRPIINQTSAYES